jgi:hypothetical protein
VSRAGSGPLGRLPLKARLRSCRGNAIPQPEAAILRLRHDLGSVTQPQPGLQKCRVATIAMAPRFTTYSLLALACTAAGADVAQLAGAAPAQEPTGRVGAESSTAAAAAAGAKDMEGTFGAQALSTPIRSLQWPFVLQYGFRDSQQLGTEGSYGTVRSGHPHLPGAGEHEAVHIHQIPTFPEQVRTRLYTTIKSPPSPSR